MEARKGDLSDDQYQQLLALAVEREDQLTATPEDADPFND